MDSTRDRLVETTTITPWAPLLVIPPARAPLYRIHCDMTISRGGTGF